MNLKNIISGFSNMVFTRTDIEELSKYRRVFCRGCEMSNFGKSRFCLKKRGGCGCVIAAKTRVPEEECPIKKWQAV